MANQFFVEIHNHISRLIETGAKEAADAQARQHLHAEVGSEPR
jgi:hypothetical protein